MQHTPTTLDAGGCGASQILRDESKPREFFVEYFGEEVEIAR